jgi:hypothetical protein
MVFGNYVVINVGRCVVRTSTEKGYVCLRSSFGKEIPEFLPRLLFLVEVSGNYPDGNIVDGIICQCKLCSENAPTKKGPAMVTDGDPTRVQRNPNMNDAVENTAVKTNPPTDIN